MSLFHAYDIRGMFANELGIDDAYRIGFFLPRLLNADRLLVGRDCRESSPELFQALARGICDAGADVDDVGLATTPMVYWLTAELAYAGSVCITASHSPPNHNGFKISGPGSRPIGAEAGLKRLERWVRGEAVAPVAKRGRVRVIHERERYLSFLRAYLPSLKGLKLAVDTGNGMGGLFARELLGESADYLFEHLDGRFPNHGPDPLNPKNREALADHVREHGCDLGIAFDGDADRVFFLDETGAMAPPDLILAVLADYFLSRGEPNITVVQDLRSSRSVAEYLLPRGATIDTWKVGRANGSARLRELDATLGGELAGHYYFRDFAYSDSAMLAMLLVLDVFGRWKSSGRGSFSSLIAVIRRYHGSGEINFRVSDTDAAIRHLASKAPTMGAIKSTLDIDGVRVEYRDWWFCVRASNTEPLLRLVVETRDPALTDERVGQLSAEIAPFVASNP
ncbi:MAG: phosphomannomutase/phosphoglucomutase [Burkholderiaceae bacterium]